MSQCQSLHLGTNDWCHAGLARQGAFNGLDCERFYKLSSVRYVLTTLTMVSSIKTASTRSTGTGGGGGHLNNLVRSAAVILLLGTLSVLWHAEPVVGLPTTTSTTSHRQAAAGSSKRDQLTLKPPAKCVVLERRAMQYHGGYGDYIRLMHRTLLVAQTLGCEYIPRYSTIGLWTRPAGTIESKSMSIELDHVVACSADDMVNTTALLSPSDSSCDITLSRPRTDCTIVTYAPTRHEYHTPKLHCIKDAVRTNWRLTPQAFPGCPRYAAIHYRWGDIASWGLDHPRLTKAWEVDAVVTAAEARGIPAECVFVYAQAYPHPRINGTTSVHTILPGGDALTTMTDMSGAEILFLRGSGMDLVPAMLKTDGYIVCGGASCLEYRDLRHSSVGLCHVDNMDACADGVTAPIQWESHFA